jgi:hypothetical protein
VLWTANRQICTASQQRCCRQYWKDLRQCAPRFVSLNFLSER